MQPVYQYQMPACAARSTCNRRPFQHLPPHEFRRNNNRRRRLGGAVPPPNYAAAPAAPNASRRRPAASRGRRARRLRRPPSSTPASASHGVQRHRRAVGRAVGGGRRRGAHRLRPFSGVRVLPPAAVGGTVTDADATAAPSAAAPPPTAPWAPMPPPMQPLWPVQSTPPGPAFSSTGYRSRSLGPPREGGRPTCFFASSSDDCLVFPPECIFDLPSLFLQLPADGRSAPCTMTILPYTLRPNA